MFIVPNCRVYIVVTVCLLFLILFGDLNLYFNLKHHYPSWGTSAYLPRGTSARRPHTDNNNDIILYNKVLHVRVGACVRSYGCACVRARIYVCMITILYYISIYAGAACAYVCAYVLHVVSIYVHANVYAYVCAGACAYAIARVRRCAYVRMCVRDRLHACVCLWACAYGRWRVRAHACAREAAHASVHACACACWRACTCTSKGWRMTDYRRERQSYVSRAGGDEGGHDWDGRTVLREMWGRQDRRKTGRRRQDTRRVEKTIRWGGEKVAGSTSPLTKGN